MRTTRFAPLIALGFLLACQATETDEQMRARMQAEADSASAAIEALGVAFTQHFNAGHADSLATFYAPNAVVMPPGVPSVTGRDSIAALFQGFMASLPAGTTLAFEVQRVSTNGPMAIERGAWSMTTPGAEGEPQVSRGKYLVHWHRIDGQWLIVEDTWNDDAPASMP